MKLQLAKNTLALKRSSMWLIFALFMLSALGVVHFSLFEAFGLKVHTNLLASIVFHQELPPALQQWDFLVFLACGVGLCIWLPKAKPLGASALAFAASAATFIVAYHNAVATGVVPLEFTLLTILVLFSTHVLLGYFFETHEKQKIIDMFGQFVPPTVVDQIAAAPEQLKLEGEARELSVMFCDIKDFSTMSEKLEPAELAKLLNIYFTEMTDILRSYGATIDKYIGDAIMAFWGAPIKSPDHAANALAASGAMVDALPKLRNIFDQHQWPQLDIGIGINTGTMSVGNMGSRYRLAYTVIGDAVNLAARYEALTRLYDTRIIVGETTRLANPDVAFRELDHVRVKGKGSATRIYEPLLGDRSLASDALTKHHHALNAYYAGDWDTAEAGFLDLQNAAAENNYYALMRKRIRENRDNEAFDGITSFNR